MPSDEYVAGLGSLGEEFPSDEAVLEAARLAIESHVRPPLLVRRLARDGHENVAFELIQHSAGGGGPETEIACGLAERGDLEAALRLAESMATLPAFSPTPGVLVGSPVTMRGEAIAGVAEAWLAREGPQAGDRFLRLMTSQDQLSKEKIVGAIALTRAKAGDPEVLSGMAKLRGMLAFETQMGAFWGYLSGGHLALATNAQQHAVSNQASTQLGALAAKYSERGDLERAREITGQLRGQEKAWAWGEIVRVLCDQGRFDLAQEMIVERPAAGMTIYLAWARAFAGQDDPLPARPALIGLDRARMLEYAALGARRIDPWHEAYP